MAIINASNPANDTIVAVQGDTLNIEFDFVEVPPGFTLDGSTAFFQVKPSDNAAAVLSLTSSGSGGITIVGSNQINVSTNNTNFAAGNYYYALFVTNQSGITTTYASSRYTQKSRFGPIQ